jgi:hypothetical protein
MEGGKMNKGRWSYRLIEGKDFEGKKCLMLRSAYIDNETDEIKTSDPVDWDDILGDNVVTEMEAEFILDDLHNQLLAKEIKCCKGVCCK